MHTLVGRLGLSFLVSAALLVSVSNAHLSTAAGAPPATDDHVDGKTPETLFIRAQRLIRKPGDVLDNAQIIVRDGKIVAVGQDLVRPAGAREIEGQVVCSAFLDSWGALGISSDALFDGATSASSRTVDSFDNFSNDHLRREAVRAGVTCARLQAGSTSRVSGVGALVRLAPGLSREEAIVLRDCDVSMSVGLSANSGGPQPFEVQGEQVVLSAGGTKAMDPFDRLSELDRVIAAIEGGKNYLQAKVEYKHDLEAWEKTISEKETELDKDAKKAKKDREKEQKDATEKGKEFKEKKYKEDKKPTPPRYDEDNEVMARVANGEIPLIVHAHRAAEIRGLLQGTANLDRLRLILAGGTEALACAKQLAERRIPVLVWPALRGKGAPDEYQGSDLALAARLSREGVTVLLGSGGADAGASRDLPLLAELAVGNGLDREKAFDALTITAARMLDVADRLGSVERGKDAELLVLDGEPLATPTSVRYVISGGRVVVTPED